MKGLHRDDRTSQVMAIGSKPVFGVPLGKCKMIFRYAGQRSFIELEGFVFDATTLFCNSEVQAEFKELIFEEIEFLQANRKTVIPSEPKPPSESVEVSAIQPVEKTPLEQAQDEFRKYDFTKACNVLILEETFTHQRHIILQVARLGVLTEYASYSDRSQWNLMRGLKVEFIVDGLGISFPHKQRLMDVGEVFIHIFIPTDHRTNSAVALEALEKAKPLALIVPFIPQALDVKELLKAKDAIIDSKDESMRTMRSNLTEQATVVDAASIAVSGHQTKAPAISLVPKRFDFIDVVLLGVPTLLFGSIAYAIEPVGWFVGVVLGGLAGLGLVFRRR